MQAESGVDKILLQQLNYQNYVNETNEIYDFWVRPTIPWKIECESQDHLKRPDVLEIARDTAAIDHTAQPQAIFFMCALLAFCSVVCIPS